MDGLNNLHDVNVCDSVAIALGISISVVEMRQCRLQNFYWRNSTIVS